MIKLLGILLIAIGFAFRVNALLVVLASGLLTGLLAGFSLNELMAMIGQFFIDQRNLTLPVILMVPVIGLLEKHGLQERVAALIRRTRAATAGRVIWIYQVARAAASTLGINLGNHASMVRPLVVPMAEGAAGVERGAAGDAARGAIRAHAAAAENVGNFFSDDVIVAVGALLLINGFFETAGVAVKLGDLKWWSVPTALWVVALGWWRYRRLDARLAAAKRKEAP